MLINNDIFVVEILDSMLWNLGQFLYLKTWGVHLTCHLPPLLLTYLSVLEPRQEGDRSTGCSEMAIPTSL